MTKLRTSTLTCITRFAVYSNSPSQRFCQNSKPPDLTGVRRVHFYSDLNASAGFGFQANRPVTRMSEMCMARRPKKVGHHCSRQKTEARTGRLSAEKIMHRPNRYSTKYYRKVYQTADLQYRPVGESQPKACLPRHQEAEVGLDWSHLAKASRQFNRTRSELEPTGEALCSTGDEYEQEEESVRTLTRLMYIRLARTTCGSVTNASAGDIDLSAYSSHYYNRYHRNGICVWTIEAEEDEVIQLLITELNIQREIPGCNDSARSYVEIYDGSQTNNSLLLRACSAYELPGYNPVTSTTRRLVVVLTLDEEFGFTQAYFTARYKSFNESAFLRDCGGDISGDQGVVSSPNYPANYDNLRECEWRITVEDLFNIRMDIHDLDIRPSYYGCHGDSLLILQVPAYNPGYFVPPEAKKFCGKGATESLTTYFPTTLHFVTDGNITKGGFNISFVSTMAGCGESLLVGEKGFITSPNYPGTFPQSLRCNTTIRVEPGHKIILTFTSFFLSDFLQPDNGQECLWWYEPSLDIYDSLPTGSAWIGRYCGYTSPQPITSTSNELSLIFTSNNNYYATGFNATYTTGISQILSGTISLIKIGRWTKVCSRHFVPEDFRLLPLKGKQRRLKPDAVPSLFTLNNFQLGKERKQLAVSHPLSLANINTNQSKNGDAKPTTEPATAETEPATAAAESVTADNPSVEEQLSLAKEENKVKKFFKRGYNN
ncbi:hypothetical protein C0Q70_02885 [Pomacea canaliculata]|uniref:CUB domain-containing protein n=1 Tax=Pomacea canaliculata TaxID=400727 RepID=A0A2T7PR59_POMCA|nr:hypothetical protein C0Q70_02885 [Pomacea canaliculata]